MINMFEVKVKTQRVLVKLKESFSMARGGICGKERYKNLEFSLTSSEFILSKEIFEK